MILFKHLHLLPILLHTTACGCILLIYFLLLLPRSINRGLNSLNKIILITQTNFKYKRLRVSISHTITYCPIAIFYCQLLLIYLYPLEFTVIPKLIEY